MSSKGNTFKPGVVAIVHALFDPSSADQIARHASYAAWVELNKERQNTPTLDLAVWPSRSAAIRALVEYRAGGPKTRPRVQAAWPHNVRRVERIRNVTLAWYRAPTIADERTVRDALRFSRGPREKHDYTTLWVIPGTLIDPDATAATGAARYSASLTLGCRAGVCPGAARGSLTVAIWPSGNAAKRYIGDLESPPSESNLQVRRIRNATVDNAASFGSAAISPLDEAAIRNALH